jgi:hypothetical protein
MAATDVLSVNKTKFDAGASGDNYLEQGDYQGVVRHVYDTYVSAALETASTIKLINMPKGAKIRGIRIVHGAMGTSVTCKIGDSDDDDRYYATGTDIAAIGQKDSILLAGVNYVIGTADGDDVILITTEAATMDADETMKFIISYVM